MLSVRLLTVAYVALLFTPSAFPQANQTDCKSLVLQSGPAQMYDAQPQKGEKYRRPPMVAYEVKEDGVVRGLRLVRHSGIKDLDQALLDVASGWKYRTRPGCGSAKVPLAAGPIPDKTTALKVAEPELNRTYGERIIRSEQPLDANLSGDMWIVGGTLHCNDGKNGTTTACVGGVATAHLTKSDGRVLQIFHTM
jgi:NTF2 fold immunity protein